MDVLFVHPYLLQRMARMAEFVAFFLQEQLGHNAVAEVALFTLLVFHNSVDAFIPIFFRELRMAVEALLPRKLPLGLRSPY
jgi:hypothetical protein